MSRNTRLLQPDLWPGYCPAVSVMVAVLTASVAPWPLTFLLLRCVLAAIFAAAAVSKALDRKGTQTAVTELGIHEQFVSRAAAAVVIAEIAVATCLVVTPLAAFGARGALALLIVLSVIVAVNLRAVKELTKDADRFFASDLILRRTDIHLLKERLIADHPLRP